ncbi:MAG: hypothetical protein O3B25_11525 [Verrucomicrobia bacterium]|nr:hypothetical protein [Verrucomicrobiota bacterium]
MKHHTFTLIELAPTSFNDTVEPNGKAAWQIVLVIFIGGVSTMVVKLLGEQFTRL